MSHIEEAKAESKAKVRQTVDRLKVGESAIIYKSDGNADDNPQKYIPGELLLVKEIGLSNSVVIGDPVDYEEMVIDDKLPMGSYIRVVRNADNSLTAEKVEPKPLEKAA